MAKPKNKCSTHRKQNKCRKKISLQEKLNILDKLSQKQSLSQISQYHGLAKTTVLTIEKNRNKIKQSYANVCSSATTNIVLSRDPIMEKMESLLYLWFTNQREKGSPLSAGLIREKAESLYESVKVRDGGTKSFLASNGWFRKFKRRYNLSNVKLSGEAASADYSAASDYLFTFREIISDGNYSPEQVYNVDETALYWKSMQSRSYVSSGENRAGFKTHKDRVTLLLGGNASGSLKLKPLLVHRAKNPRALKNCKKEQLPVIWHNNTAAWMTKKIFTDWFTTYFAPIVEKNNKEKNLDNKAILILDNATSHSANLKDIYPHIDVIYLPPNTTSILQPMDQGVIATFKSNFLRKTLKRVVQYTSGGEGNVMSFWKTFTIKDAVDMISEAWNGLSSQNMKGVWSKLWPELRSNEHSVTDTPKCYEEIIELSQQVGLENVTVENINEYIATHDESITNDELLQIELDSIVMDNDNDIPQVCTLTIDANERREKLDNCLQIAEKLKKAFTELEESEGARRIFSSTLDGLFSSYKSN